MYQGLGSRDQGLESRVSEVEIMGQGIGTRNQEMKLELGPDGDQELGVRNNEIRIGPKGEKPTNSSENKRVTILIEMLSSNVKKLKYL